MKDFIIEKIESKFCLYIFSLKLSECSFGIFLNSYVKMLEYEFSSSFIVLVELVVLMKIKIPSLSVIISLVALHITVLVGSKFGDTHTLSNDLI